MSTPNPIEVAAAPSLIAALQAIEQFLADMGNNPLLWVANFPGAQLKLIGTIQLQLPSLATAEGGAIQTAINTQLTTWITQLQNLSKPAA